MMKTGPSKFRCHLFFLLMVCFAAAILGDSTAESLLLARFGTSFVPKMFLVNAAALFILSAGMLSIVDKLDRRKFFSRALFGHGCVLLAMRFAVSVHWDVLFLPLFSYAYSSKILFFLLFWTVANDLIDSRSAGKEFPAIAAGGTIGAIAVSFSITALMKFLAVENLLLLWAALVFLSSFLLLPLRGDYGAVLREKKTGTRVPASSAPPLAMTVILREEPLLRTMSMLYALIFFLLLNQHFVFYRTIKTVFDSAEKIASFLGSFNGVSMLLTVIMQVSIAGVLMRTLGSTRSMLLLPTALLAIFSVQLVMCSYAPPESASVFMVIVAGMGIRIAFFDSFFSPNFQLFFSSLPKDIRGRGKLLIEGVVKPFSMVIAGSFLLWAAPKLSIRIHLMLMAAVAAVALVQTIRLKQAYTRTLTRYLTGIDEHRNDALLARFNFGGGEDFLSFFAKRLDSEEFEVQKFLVDIIAEAGNDDAASLLLDYVNHADLKLRATVVAALGKFPAALVEDTLISFLDDKDHRVVANAVEALDACASALCTDHLPRLLLHVNRRVRCNVILALWPQADLVSRQNYREQLQEMLYGNGAEECASALFVLGMIDDEACTMMLYNFCRIKAEGGLQSGIVFRRAVAALGRKKTEDALDLLLLMVQYSTVLQRNTVNHAVAGLLPHCMEQEWVRRLERGNAVYKNCLLKALRKADIALTTAAVQVLGRIAAREAEAIEWEKQSIQLLTGSGSDKMSLLSCAVREEVVSIRLENIMTIAALNDTTGIIGSVVPRLHHSDRHVRARAFEILENSGDVKLNRTIINCIEWLDALPKIEHRGFPAVGPKELAAAGSYCTSHNRWVAICAEYATT